MRQVNMLEAKSTLSRLIEDIEQGKYDEVVIARNGRPAAKLVAIDATSAKNRIGVAKGKFEIPDDIDAGNERVSRLFQGGDAS
ncbi:MAG: type II toxin-antitoxin system Phd/YefM family antitoxin [Burkholderiaceae bacterium]